MQAACGDHDGTITLRINSANPTVSTASAAFVGAAGGAGGWEGQVWDDAIAVPLHDARRADRATMACRPSSRSTSRASRTHVLPGLTQPGPAALLRVHHDPARCRAKRCLERLEALGPYRFNVALGESQRLELATLG